MSTDTDIRNLIETFEFNSIQIEIDGKKELWQPIWWSANQKIWENSKHNRLLFRNNKITQFGYFELFEISYEDYCKILIKTEHEKNLEDRTTDILHESGYQSKFYYSLKNNQYKLFPFNKDKLIKTNPEWFI